ncbi:MAG TPA: heavy-metal-associated domain-containing protein [Cytophagaceae bacterium]|jgi:mercuric ion binding protein|nr:heavy-metal-associated domain-containing protein [Cytophagaceae bacterium]
MKTTSLLLAICFSIFAISFTTANTTKFPGEKTVEFKVSGNCGMCKNTIESSLKDAKGVKSSSWNKDTKVIKVTYDPAQISEEQIHQKISDSGYDTEKKKGSDKSYNSLHKCCQYNRTMHK